MTPRSPSRTPVDALTRGLYKAVADPEVEWVDANIIRLLLDRYDAATERVADAFPPELLNARIRFWSCPDHRGAPHRVEWDGNVARCLTCGRTSQSGHHDD